MALGKIGKYEKLDVLGHGASGIVYLAWDTLLGRHVALKEINLQAADESRFIEEARVLDRLRHPNIVRVNNVDKVDGQLIIDMEYVKGTSLQKLLSKNGRLSVREALSIAIQICDALDFAHKHHIVHRDIKPANVLISQEGIVKIVDFGLAEILGSGSYAGGAGTYAYMAPEDFAEEESSDYRSDIWAVGVTLYEMLTGRRPFQAAKPKDPFSWKRAVEEDAPPPLSEIEPPLSKELEQVLAKALAKDKCERYQSAKEMREDLSKILESLGASTSLYGLNREFAFDETDFSKQGIVDKHSKPESIEGIIVRPQMVDFGKLRKGESSRRKVVVRVNSKGRVAARVVSLPGWVFVSPHSFHHRKEVLTMQADTQSILQPGVYHEEVVLQIDGSRVSIPVLVNVLPPRREFVEVLWWYLPAFLLSVMPLVVCQAAGDQDKRTAGLIATGLLSTMLLIISIAADLGIVEKLLPAAVGAVGFGSMIGIFSQWFENGLLSNARGFLLVSVLATPLSLLVALQFLTASRWRFWVVVLMVCSICASWFLAQ
jgi:serine/threonine-protein kinase